MTSPPISSLSVKDFMTQDVIAVTPTTSIRRVLEIMTDHHIGAVPVVDDGRCVGIVTSSDLLRVLRETNDALHQSYPHYEDCLWAVDLARRKLDESPVREVMSFAVATVSPSTSIRDAAKQMQEQSIHHLAVFEGSEFVGFLSSMDLVGTMAG